MKKLIAIAVVLALVAGAAFAQANVGIEVAGGLKVLSGSSEKILDTVESAKQGKPVFMTDDVVYAGGDMGEIRIFASGQTEDGKLGADVRFQSGSYGVGTNGWGWIWWKPIDQFRFQIGTNGGDVEFGLDGIGGWGFYGQADTVKVIGSGNVWGGGYTDIDIAIRKAYYGGFNDGAILTLTPAEGLVINIGIPFFKGDKRADDIFKKTEAQIKYDIANIGTVGLSIQGDLSDKQEGGYPANDNPTAYFFFGLTAVDNLGLDIGLGYKFADTVEFSGGGKATINNPLYLGLGASYNAGAFGIKLRTVMSLGGDRTVTPASGDTKVTPDQFKLLADILPSYAVNDNVTILLSAGLGILGAKYDADGKELMDSLGNTQARTAWHIEPYVSVKASGWWSPNIFFGIRLESNGKSDASSEKDKANTYVKWSVPIGIMMAF